MDWEIDWAKKVYSPKHLLYILSNLIDAWYIGYTIDGETDFEICMN